MTETGEVGSAGVRTAPEPTWWIELARMLGETIGRAKATVTPLRSAGTRRSTEALLGELGKIVSDHAERGYGSLESEPRFWALVRHLHLRHHEMRAKPPRAKPDAARAAGTDDAEKPAPAEVTDAPTGPSEEASAGSEVPDEAPHEGDEAPHEGDEAPHEGDEAPHEGDEAPHEGDEAPGKGDEAPDEGDEAPDEGDGKDPPGGAEESS